MDWDGNFYIGITLKWYYTNSSMKLYMSGYVWVTLANYSHTKLSLPQDIPHPWVVPQYGIKNSQLISLPQNPPDIMEAQLTQHQNILVTLLSYACAVDNTMLMPLNVLAAYKNKVTENTAKHLMHFLNYCAKQPKVSIDYQCSDMFLYASSYVFYLL